METIVKVNKWANSHTNILFDALRLGLGVFLFWKGMLFAGQTQTLVDLMQPKDPQAATIFIAHYIAMAHLAGGILVFFGLLTRLALVIQVPILVGAVVMNINGNAPAQDLYEACAALLLSVFFVVMGSGKHSADYSWKMNM